MPYTVLRTAAGRSRVAAWHLHVERIAAGAAALYDAPRVDDLEARLRRAVRAAASDASIFAGGSEAVVALALSPDLAVVAHAAADAAPPAMQHFDVELVDGRRAAPRIKSSAWCSERRPLEALAAQRHDRSVSSARVEAVLVDGGGLLEGLTTNLFCYSSADAMLRTAPDDAVLPGVARAMVIDAARRRGIRVEFEAPRVADAAAWSEVFVTNAKSLVGRVRRVADGGVVVFSARDFAITDALRQDVLDMLATDAWAPEGFE